MSLCDPGVTRFHGFIPMKDMSNSIADVRKVVCQRKICSEIKTQPLQPPAARLIKERLSLGFKRLLLLYTKNHYI